MECEICNNKLSIFIGVVPVEGSIGYQVTKVECPRLPFYGEKVVRQVANLVRKDPNQLGEEVVERLRALAQELDLKIDIDFNISKDPNLNCPREEKYAKETSFNLYVDFGSTNAKWMIVSCDAQGHLQEIRSIARMAKTTEVCADFGIRYDKAKAYTYGREDFEEWLCSAVLTFVRQIQAKEVEYANDVYWAFPKLIVDGQKSQAVEFDDLSKFVTERLRQFGLKGKFVLMSEANALEAMFRNRVLHIAMACEEEEDLNAREKAAAEEHNRQEDVKVAQNKDAQWREEERYREACRKFEADHTGSGWMTKCWGAFKKKFIDNPPTKKVISHYNPEYRVVELDRHQELKEYRTMGVDSRMPFSMLLLDAGGSTLDYCYIPGGDSHGRRSSGSYRAGGRTVTELMMKSLPEENFSVAEDRKCTLAEMGTNPKIVEATKAVYEKVLLNLGDRIEKRDPHLCVVCTGLAMDNVCLRRLVREKLSLPGDLKMIWSEDVVRDLPDAVGRKYQDVATFVQIVCRNQKDGQPSPANDVIGGLYFASKEGGGK